MKKFKLIAIYPGAPPVDTIVEEQIAAYKEIKGTGLSTYRKSYSKNSVEDFPVYWKEIGILGNFLTEDGVEVEEGITKVAWAFLPINGGKWIQKYKSVPFTNSSAKSKQWKAFSTTKALQTWLMKKYPTSIFTTIDRKEICYYQPYWVLIKSSNKIEKYICGGGEVVEDNKLLRFSSLEAAQDYRLENTPTLSIKDVKDIISKVSVGGLVQSSKEDFFSNFYEFANNKLNK